MNTLVKNGNQPSTQRRERYDPWSNFLDLENFFSPDWLGRPRNVFPAVNVSENDKQYNVDIVAPGFKKEDFKVNVEDDTLTISAETKQESNEEDKEKQYSRREYSYSSFTRSFQLPDNAQDDQIGASYTDGVLKLIIPKSQQQVKASKEVRID